MRFVHAQLYLPLVWSAAQRQERRVANYFVLGRMKPGVGLDHAAMKLDMLARTLEREHPVDNKDTGILIQPLRDQMIANVRPALMLIFTAAASVLLLTCFNLANLLTARGIEHQRELSIRAAPGASRLRLLRQTLTEGLVIACLGGVLGLGVGFSLLRAFVGLFNDTRYFALPRRAEVGFDWRVFAFVLLVCVVSAILFSLGPAARATRSTVVTSLRRPDRPADRRWRNMLLIGEIALALMLVVACVQLLRSYAHLQNQERGFQAGDLLTARIVLPDGRYSTPAARAAFFRRLLSRAVEEPNVLSVGAVQLLPLNGVGSLRTVSRPDRVGDRLPPAFHFVVTPGYLETMRIPLVAGRAFTVRDSAEASRVAVLSLTAAARYFPNENPIGKLVRIEDVAPAEWEVIGIVADVRSQRLDRVPQPQIYVPLEQSPASAMTLVVRSRNHDPLSLARGLREAVRTLDSEQGVADIKSMIDVVNDSAARWRVSTGLFVAFGGTALLLALVGLYGMTAFNVAQRSREFAIRAALGGSRRSIVALVLRPLSGVLIAAVAIGWTLSIAVARLLASLLFGVTPVDPAVFGGASAVFVMLVVTTGGWAAYRTTDIQPADALKVD